MRFVELALPGVLVVEPEPSHDARGLFARTFCRETFLAHGLDDEIVQCSLSHNHRRGTIRGLHWQAEPWAETKLVRCTAGAAFDVVVDMRPASPTVLQWIGIELTAANRRAMYVPEGCAHGFQTLADDTEIAYQISTPYRPDAARGARWDDPAFAIDWPLPVTTISARDRSFPPVATEAPCR